MKAVEVLRSWWAKPWTAHAPIWVGELDDETVLEHARMGNIELLIATKDCRPWKKTWYCVGTAYECDPELGIVIGPIRAWEENGELLLTAAVSPIESAHLKRIYDNAPQLFKNRIAHIERLVMESGVGQQETLSD